MLLMKEPGVGGGKGRLPKGVWTNPHTNVGARGGVHSSQRPQPFSHQQSLTHITASVKTLGPDTHCTPPGPEQNREARR